MALVFDTSTTGVASSGNITLNSWSPAANTLLVVCIGMRDETNANPTISGNGVTWNLIRKVDNAQGQCGIVAYYAYAASPSSGAITVTFTSNGSPASAIAYSFTGADSTTPIEVDQGNAGPPPPTDTDDMLDSITTLTDGAVVVGMGTHRTRDFTTPADETAIQVNILGGGGGDSTRTSAWYLPVANNGTVEIGEANDLSSAIDWCMISISIKPAGGAPPAAPVKKYYQMII